MILRPLLATFLLASSFASAQAIRPGDHVAIVGNTFADQLRIHSYFETILLQQTAENPVSVRNLGWAGDMLSVRGRPTNFPAETATLSAHQTDVIIACFGMGESFAGEAGVLDFRAQLDAFLAFHRGKKYNGESEVRIVLVTPIAYEDLGEITPNVAQRNADLARYSQAIAVLAAERKIPFWDLNSPMRELMAAEGPKLTMNGITLRAYGHWAAAGIMARPDPAWLLEVDTAAGTATARGGRIAEFAKDGAGLRFTHTETSWPQLPPPAGLAHADLPRDRMIARGLAPGNYRLEVDGQPVASASADVWAAGVIIESTPAHAEAEALRQAVNDKNRQFTYSWKALNQVHIVGERKKSHSGKSLPAEVIAFNTLADEKDAALRTHLTLKTRNWRLAPEAK
ncbi:MAG: hypothetical protein ACI8W8_002187 [Rhodothermales bacterium]|jgi:hypothetical protein